MDAPDTLQLIRRAKRGDERALDDLFGRFSSHVRRIVELKVGGRRHQAEQVDDLVQDALTRAYQGFDRFGGEPGDDFRAFLAVCARCAVFDDYNRRKALKRGGDRVVRNFSDWSSSFLAASIFGGDGETPSAVVMRQEAEAAVYAALSELSDRHRDLVVYRYLCDMSYREIADRLGLASEGSARVLCLRARERLREELGGETASATSS